MHIPICIPVPIPSKTGRLSLMDSMLDAEQEIIGCITGRPPSGDDMKMTRNIVDAIEKMTR